jgi:hypothetical protein
MMTPVMSALTLEADYQLEVDGYVVLPACSLARRIL